MKPKILIADLKQETATFNPLPTKYEDFRILRGTSILEAFRGTATEIAGALAVLETGGDFELVPTVAADAVSGGAIKSADLDRLLDEITASVRTAGPVTAAYLCFHGAMAGEDEGDPEGRLLEDLRAILGDIPLVVSIDLHAVITDRLITGADVLVPYHTYPHTDHFETGRRAAKVLLQLMNQEIRPTTARVKLPMLVRGDELLTSTGLFGEAIQRCQRIEETAEGVAAGVIIGNAFTDVPELQSNVLVTTDNNLQQAKEQATEIARFMWEHRTRFQATLLSLSESLRIATETDGLTVFSDAADATASGASGDSNAILEGVLDTEFVGTVLLSMVDAPAVGVAFHAGIGATIKITLGGTRDPGRFCPLAITARVRSLHDGEFTYEDGTAGSAGRTAVLVVGNVHVLTTERSVYVVGRRVFQQHGLEPTDFDVVVAKSPNGFRTWYESIATRIVPVDVPGSTSANLKSLPFKNCPRPMFPLDSEVTPPFTMEEG